MLKKLFFVAVLLFSLCENLPAQKDSLTSAEQVNQEKKSYIFAQLEKASNAEVKLKVEQLDRKLSEDVYLHGYIINYGTPKAIARREMQIRNSIRFRKFDATRITLVRGENIGKLKSVFWIVPAGAQPPTP